MARGDSDAYFHVNEDFHTAIYAASHNSFLSEQAAAAMRGHVAVPGERFADLMASLAQGSRAAGAADHVATRSADKTSGTTSRLPADQAAGPAQIPGWFRRTTSAPCAAARAA